MAFFVLDVPKIDAALEFDVPKSDAALEFDVPTSDAAVEFDVPKSDAAAESGTNEYICHAIYICPKKYQFHYNSFTIGAET